MHTIYSFHTKRLVLHPIVYLINVKTHQIMLNIFFFLFFSCFFFSFPAKSLFSLSRFYHNHYIKKERENMFFVVVFEMICDKKNRVFDSVRFFRCYFVDGVEIESKKNEKKNFSVFLKQEKKVFSMLEMQTKQKIYCIN